jgi:hypothetical protein
MASFSRKRLACPGVQALPLEHPTGELGALHAVGAQFASYGVAQLLSRMQRSKSRIIEARAIVAAGALVDATCLLRGDHAKRSPRKGSKGA